MQVHPLDSALVPKAIPVNIFNHCVLKIKTIKFRLHYTVKHTLFILLAVYTGFLPLAAQSLSLEALFALSGASAGQIDTLLLQKGYLLEEQDADSMQKLRYYTSIAQHAAEPTWVRSVTIIDVRKGEREGRMIQYRTYQPADQEAMLAWLLQKEFTTVKRYEVDGETHTIYSDGNLRLLVKTGWATLPNKRRLRYYVWELGT